MTTQNTSAGMFGAAGDSLTEGSERFPNPFCDIASQYIPRDLNVIFEACEYLMMAVTPFRAVSQSIVRYFLTELVLEGESDDEREKCEDFLHNKLHLMQQLSEVGDEYMTYGQSFVSLYFPFDRYLMCPKCATLYHVKTIQYKFDRKTGDFICDCIKCGAKKVTFRREDRRSPDADGVKFLRWSPKDIRLRVHPISGEIEYYLSLDNNFVEKLLDGEPFYLDSTPWAMVKACVDSGRNGTEYLFKFRKDAIYHLKTGTLAGLPVKGWAIPPILPNFKLAYYVQLLRGMDEAIALDFILPFRVLYPEQTGGTDPLGAMNMGSFVARMKEMVANKRRNKTDIQISPFPIGYAMLGGEAKSLAPKDNIALAVDELLNSLGFPSELWHGKLSIQAAPMALRLFQQSWNGLVDGYDELISWVLSRLSRHFMWGKITGALREVTLADDIERKALNLQAAAGMDISKQTAYRPLGLDYLEEQRRVVEEQEAIQQLQQEAMERAQAQAGEQQPGPDGQPAPGATPGDVEEQAQALAEQLLLQTPETMRRGELIKIKHSNSTLHALVIQKMDQMRQDMAREGQAMMMEQAKTASAVGLGEARALPSPVRLALLIADQVTNYTRDDMRKIASDIGRNVKGARDAFRFIYSKIMGWS